MEGHHSPLVQSRLAPLHSATEQTPTQERLTGFLEFCEITSVVLTAYGRLFWKKTVPQHHEACKQLLCFISKYSHLKWSIWHLSFNVVLNRILTHLDFNKAQRTSFQYLSISLALSQIPQLTLLRSCSCICFSRGNSRRYPTKTPLLPVALPRKGFFSWIHYIMIDVSMDLAVSLQPFTLHDWKGDSLFCAQCFPQALYK